MSNATAIIIGASLIATAILAQGYMPGRVGAFQIAAVQGHFWRLDTRTGAFQQCGRSLLSSDILAAGECGLVGMGEPPRRRGQP